jgi:hypothetical protein
MITSIDNETVTHVISDYHAADDTKTVEIIVTGFSWDVRKTVELINAAPKIYAALGDLVNAVYRSGPAGLDDDVIAVLLQAQRAEAAACGGILMQDRMVQK